MGFIPQFCRGVLGFRSLHDVSVANTTFSPGIPQLLTIEPAASKTYLLLSGFLVLWKGGLGSFGGCALFPEQSADLFP